MSYGVRREVRACVRTCDAACERGVYAKESIKKAGKSSFLRIYILSLIFTKLFCAVQEPATSRDYVWEMKRVRVGLLSLVDMTYLLGYPHQD